MFLSYAFMSTLATLLEVYFSKEIAAHGCRDLSKQTSGEEQEMNIVIKMPIPVKWCLSWYFSHGYLNPYIAE